MAMSPWMPPTYLWLGVEGLLGVSPVEEGCIMNPCLPPGWDWLAVKDLLWRGEKITVFLTGGTLYASRHVTGAFPCRCGSLLNVSSSSTDLLAIAMRAGADVLLFVASDPAAAGPVSVDDGNRVIEQAVSLAGGAARLYTFSGTTS
jgi:hypothetical protein